MPNDDAPIFPDLFIADDRVTRVEGKGHAFRATLFAHACADGMWESGTIGDRVYRPVWMLLGCSENEAAAVRMNLQMGRPGLVPTGEEHGGRPTYFRYELMARAKYTVRKEAHPEGVVVKAYLPALFRRDPGMIDGDTARFILLPDRQLLQAQKLAAGPAVTHVRKVGCPWSVEVLRALVPYAPLFLAYLNRRTRCPLLPDLAFALQVLVGSLDKGFATRAASCPGPWKTGLFGYTETNVEHVGAMPGIAFMATKGELEPFLAEQVARYLKQAPITTFIGKTASKRAK